MSGIKKDQRLPQDVSAALAEVERVVTDTQRRALNLLHDRQIIDRNGLWMWLSGSPDACWQVTGIVERETEFVITVALPGVDERFVELTRQPRELAIRAPTGLDANIAGIEHRLRLPVDLRSELVAVYLSEGSLVIVAPRKPGPNRHPLLS